MSVSDGQVLEPAIGTLAEGRSWIGRRRELNAPGTPITEGSARGFAAAVGDRDSRYWEEDYCPPGLLFALSLPSPWRPGDARPPRTLVLDVPLPGEFAVAVESSAEFFDPLRIGDRILAVEEVIDVSNRKTTALGPGHFLTVRTEYVDGEGRLKADHTMTSLRHESASA